MTNLKKQLLIISAFILMVLLLGAPVYGRNDLVSDLWSQVRELRAKIVRLQSCVDAFSRDIALGYSGGEVVLMQKILNSDPDTQVTQTGAGSPGQETNYFGAKTKLALSRFQEKYSGSILATAGLSRGTGFLGSRTRAKLKSLCLELADEPLPTEELIEDEETSTGNSAGSGEGGVLPTPEPDQGQSESGASYPLHTNITATVFWVGEPVGNGSSEDNALSAWDDEWQAHYGGYDNPYERNGYYPPDFTPRENPFYLDLPYNDFTDNGRRRDNAYEVVPWAGERDWGRLESMMKNRWVRLTREGHTCYGQIEDAGPYVYNDYNYVFSTTDARPISRQANNAGMDVSPALRDCLHFNGQNNAANRVDWQFVDAQAVPAGPWKEIITTSQINWP